MDLKASAGTAQYGQPRKTSFSLFFKLETVKCKKFSERTAKALFMPEN